MLGSFAKITMSSPHMHVLCKCAEWTHVLHTCQSWFVSICQPASHSSSHSGSHWAFTSSSPSLVDLLLGSRVKSWGGGKRSYFFVFFFLLGTVFGAVHFMSSWVMLLPACNGWNMPGSGIFSSCLILPGNSSDLILWQVSRRLPHLFPQFCQRFYQEFIV